MIETWRYTIHDMVPI